MEQANLIVIFLVLFLILILWILFSGKREFFGKDGSEFLPVGEQRYGLRGDKLDARPIYDCRFDCYSDCYNSHI
jgi:hypothetical protein